MARNRPGPRVSPECTGTAVALPSGCLRKTWLPRVRSTTKPAFSRERGRSHFPWRGEDASYGDLLDTDELERADVVVIVLQAELDHFADALHEDVKPLGLGVTTAKGRNCSDIVAVFILLDQDGEFSFWLHARTLLQESLSLWANAMSPW